MEAWTPPASRKWPYRTFVHRSSLAGARLTHHLLYLSGYLEAHRDEYYDRPQAVREKGQPQEGLQFLFTAVTRQANDAVARASALVELREKYLAEAARSRSNLTALVPILFSNPYVTVRRVERIVQPTNAGARNIVKEAERRGRLQEIGTAGRGGRTFWIATEIFEIIEAPASYPASGTDRSAYV